MTTKTKAKKPKSKTPKPESKQAESSQTPKPFVRSFMKAFVWVLFIIALASFVLYKTDNLTKVQSLTIPPFQKPAPTQEMILVEEGEEVIPYAGAESAPEVTIESLEVAPAEIVVVEPTISEEVIAETVTHALSEADKEAAQELANLRKQMANLQLNLIEKLAQPKATDYTDFIEDLADLRLLEQNGGNPDPVLAALRQSAPETLRPAVSQLAAALPTEIILAKQYLQQILDIDHELVENPKITSIWQKWIRIERVSEIEQENVHEQCIMNAIAGTDSTPCKALGLNTNYFDQVAALNVFWQAVGEIK